MKKRPDNEPGEPEDPPRFRVYRSDYDMGPITPKGGTTWTEASRKLLAWKAEQAATSTPDVPPEPSTE